MDWRPEWRAERVDWRASPEHRRRSDVHVGPPATFADAIKLWDLLAASVATVVNVVEHADDWITRLSAADKATLAA